eukprot:6416875-Amphidinium_carterae.1
MYARYPGSDQQSTRGHPVAKPQGRRPYERDIVPISSPHTNTGTAYKHTFATAMVTIAIQMKM